MQIFLNSKTVDTLHSRVLSRLELHGESSAELSEINAMFNNLKNPFNNLTSEYLQLKYFKENGTLIYPIRHTINYRSEYTKKDGEMTINKMPITAEYIPIHKVFTKLFSNVNFYNKVISYVNFLHTCEDTVIFNIIQSQLWKKKVKISAISLYYR